MLSSQDTITGDSLKKLYTKVTSFKCIYNVCHDKNQATELNICIQIVSLSLLKTLL